MWRRIRARLTSTIRPRQEEEEFREELRLHLELMVEERMAKGMTRADAERDARLRLGGVAQLEEAHRDWRGYRFLDALAADVRASLRDIRRSPRFAATTIVTMAIAIGAASAVFQVVNHSLFRPLPYARDERLVSVGIQAPVIAANDWMFAGTFQEWRAVLHSFAAVSAWKGLSECDRNDGDVAERLACAMVDERFLPVLGVTPALGRNFTQEEDEPGAAPVVILAHGLWVSRFGGDGAVVGKAVTIDGKVARIVGVLPASFQGPTAGRMDVLMPLQLRRDGQRQRLVQMIGRLREGVPLFVARIELWALFQRFRDLAPADFRQAVPMKLRVERLRDQQMRDARTGLLLLLGAVLCFVLMACANVASLHLARGEARRHEYAVRSSLGASPGRLVQQAMVEAMVSAACGGVLGALLAYGLLEVLRVLAPASVTAFREAPVDGRVWAFALGLSLMSAMLFGSAPAWERLRPESLAAPRVAGARKQRLRSALVALQFAVTLVLLTATGLLLTTLSRLQSVQLGFRPEHVVASSFLLPAQAYGTEEAQIAFFDALHRRMQEIPGVSAAAISDSLPPGGDPRSFPFVSLVGGGDAEGRGVQGLVKWRFVTPGYFETLGVAIRQGRGFIDSDRTSGMQPLVINERLARRLFGGESAVGKTLTWGQVVGVAADVRNAGVRQTPDAEMYVVRRAFKTAASGNQRPPVGWRMAWAVVRSPLPRPAVQALLEQAIRAGHPGLAVVSQTLRQDLTGEVAETRFQSALLAGFAAIGLLLAGVGLYGLTSYLAAARTREVGVRMALGATAGDIALLVTRSALAWTAVGLGVGGLVSVWVMDAMRSLLVDAQLADARVLGASVLVLGGTAALGMALPSLRAARVDAMEALREG